MRLIEFAAPKRRGLASVVVAASLWTAAATAQSADPLPSWNDGASKQAIVAFVEAVTTEGGADFVPAPERIATFDNDGTLWIEQPIYTQIQFAFDRIEALAPEHPEWQTTEPFKALLAGDMEAVVASGKQGLVEILMASHAGMSTAEFAGIATDWLVSARHPKLDRPYTELVYQPQLELLAYLRDHGFKTYIVSGGGVEFMRPWTEEVYGIPPEQVVGSTIKTKLELQDGEPVLTRLAEVDHIDDKAGKPVAINKFIGRRPILAFGNSDGDLEMLQWTTAGDGRRLGLLVHHDDGAREYAYDRKGPIGRLDEALDLAGPAGWVVVSMQDDWASIFPTP